MPQSNTDEARVDAFLTQLWGKLWQIPTQTEIDRFLTADTVTRQQIVKGCRQRARPIIQMINEIESWKALK